MNEIEKKENEIRINYDKLISYESWYYIILLLKQGNENCEILVTKYIQKRLGELQNQTEKMINEIESTKRNEKLTEKKILYLSILKHLERIIIIKECK